MFLGRPLETGLSLTADEGTYAVIGVMPEGMREPIGRNSIWLRIPGDAGANEAERNGTWQYARLKPGVTYDVANRELAVVAQQLTQTFGAGRQPFSFQLYPVAPQPEVLNYTQKALVVASFAILLIACVNLTNLMLARGIARRRELSVRLALGATRRALIRHVLTESAVVAALGGVMGTTLTVWGMGFVRSGMPAMVISVGTMAPHLTWRVYLFAVLATGFSAIVFGLAPAFRASDISLSDPLKEGGTSTGRGKHRYSTLVIVEVAACLLLLMGAGLMFRTLMRAQRFDFGYDAEHVYQTFKNVNRRQLASDSDVPASFSGLLERVRGIEGVGEVATTSRGMMKGGVVTSDLEGAQPTFTNRRDYLVVSPAYLRLLGVPIVSGRDFEPGDQQGNEPLAIVDEVGARKLWPNANPVGRMMKLGDPSSSAEWIRVIGVAKDVGVEINPSYQPDVYVLRPHDETRMRTVVVRINGDKETSARVGRQVSLAVWGGGGNLLRSVREPWDSSLRAWTFMSRVLLTLGSLSLLLTAVGLYGVISYAVSQRMREFALRIALGAESRALLSLVLRDGAIMILAGTAVGAGVILAASVASLIEPIVSDWLGGGVPPTDAISLAAAELVLVGVSLGACWIPARRATRADPMEIIRAL